jgi:hypothetical protein
MGFFSTDRSDFVKGMQDSYGGINNIDDVMRRFGLRKRTPMDVSKTFNPARGNLATRQALANQEAGARMSGSNTTPQATFGKITSSFAPAWGDLESKAAEKGLDVSRSDEQTVAGMLDKILGEKNNFNFNKAGLLNDSSTFDDILSVASTLGGIKTSKKDKTGKSNPSNALFDMFSGIGDLFTSKDKETPR